jgi:two-component system cell cycle sensor histidine kinase/response regulator CckA
MSEDRPTYESLQIRVLQLEADQRMLEAQLRSAQKMEAIGQLARGVAHDFNNLLTVINGYVALSLNQLEPTNPLYTDLLEVMKAGERAAALTQQLLSFSRRQVSQPKPLDINRVVTETEKMLRRLVGENIDLRVNLARAPVRIKADLGHIQQVIMNLAVNARDAMPDGGLLEIETRNVTLDLQEAEQIEWLNAGPHAMLVINDNGIGMSAEIKSRVFDPFFTTKEADSGTGLGLSTVYGIVRQCGGSIEIQSAPGRGTSIIIYFPSLDESIHETQALMSEADSLRGSETILLVEDEREVRRLVGYALRRYGYKVLEAANAGEALLICEESPEVIPLMITDVVMPGMPGPKLAERLQKIRPDMKVIYVSGYTNDARLLRGIQEGNVPFFQKPFDPELLVAGIRELLDRKMD